MPEEDSRQRHKANLQSEIDSAAAGATYGVGKLIGVAVTG